MAFLRRRRSPAKTPDEQIHSVLVAAAQAESRARVARQRAAGFGQGPMVASGRAIAPDDRKQIAAYRKRMADSAWQEAAWVYNANVPILGFAHDYVRDSLARVRPFPAIMSENPDEPPVALTTDTVPKGVDLDLVDQIVQRLAPFPTYMGESALKMDISGECFVALLPDEDAISGERCQVFSNRELFTQGDEWRVRETPADGVGTPIPPDAPFWRMWQPDPEFSILPYSHMMRLNLPCEELLLLSRLIKAIGLSRIATTGKILMIADEFSLEVPTADGDASSESAGDGEGRADTFFEDFMAAATTGILDPESPSAVLPMIVRAGRDLIKDGASVLDVSRAFESELAKLRQEAREEIATGVNLPREIPLGIGATNHWNAEEIRTQAWQVHLEPRALSLMAATTTAFFQPALLENKIDPDIVRRLVMWYDPKWFLGSPDRSDSADSGLKNYAISLTAWREAKGYDESDKPDDAEVDWRIAIKQREQVRETIRSETTGNAPSETGSLETASSKPAAPGKEPLPGDSGAKSAPAVPETPDQTAPPAKQSSGNAPPAKGGKNGKAAQKQAKVAAAAAARAIVAAASADAVAGLGDRHVAIERDLRARVLQLADSTMARMLERAGLKVQGKASKPGKVAAAVRERLNAADVTEKPSVLGRDGCIALGLNDHQLLAGALVGMKPKYVHLVSRAQHQAAVVASEATGRDFDEQDLADKMGPHITAGWAVLEAGLTALALGLLYNPHPSAPSTGEFDPTTVVPPGLVRASLDRAGGAAEGETATVVRDVPIPSMTETPVVAGNDQNGDNSDATGGATAGPAMQSTFEDQMGISQDGYVWVYGEAPRREFPPHSDLDGVQFSSWDDDVLANPGSFPDYDHLFPGDHNGCMCDVAIQYTQADDTETLPPGLGVDYPSPLTRSGEADAGDSPRPSFAENAQGVSLEFDESKHPRVPKGEAGGGRFGSAGGDAGSLPPMTDPVARGEALGALMKAEIKAKGDTVAQNDHYGGSSDIVYTPEREAMHRAVTDRMLQEAIDGGAVKGNQMVVLAGLPGVGKSENKGNYLDETKFVDLSADTMKEELARAHAFEPPPGVGRMEASPMSHEEGSTMSKMLADKAMAQGYNVVWDVTGSSVSGLKDRIDGGHAAGYNVTGMLIDGTVQQSLDQAAGRYARGLARDLANGTETARYTPPGNISSMADPSGKFMSLNAKNFDTVKGSFDNGYMVVDATHGRGNEVISSSTPGLLDSNGKINFERGATRTEDVSAAHTSSRAGRSKR